MIPRCSYFKVQNNNRLFRLIYNKTVHEYLGAFVRHRLYDIYILNAGMTEGFINRIEQEDRPRIRLFIYLNDTFKNRIRIENLPVEISRQVLEMLFRKI